MREIKFRAWHTVNKVMYDSKSVPVLLKNVEDDNIWKYMQFTGLIDCMKKPIYESDIIMSRAGTKGYVVFHKGSWRIQLRENVAPLPVSYYIWAQYQIIGNIYQNPELLKK